MKKDFVPKFCPLLTYSGKYMVCQANCVFYLDDRCAFISTASAINSIEYIRNELSKRDLPMKVDFDNLSQDIHVAKIEEYKESENDAFKKGLLINIDSDYPDAIDSEQNYVNALAKKHEEAGFRIVSQNCGSPGPDLVMERDDKEIIVEAKLRPDSKELYNCIGQILRYGTSEKGHKILCVAIYEYPRIEMNWFFKVCSEQKIHIIEGIELIKGV